MATIKEIKTHIDSITDTQKITNAMYLISSTKLRRAKDGLDLTRPYFNALQTEIKRIFRVSGNVDSKYIYPDSNIEDLDGSYAYLVITSDKGLAGAYNHNVIKESIRLMKEHDNPKLFVVGEFGRHAFNAHKIPIEGSFLYTAQNPTIHRAREISAILLDLYDRKEISKIFVIYTDMKDAIKSGVCCTRLLPFHRAQFLSKETTDIKTQFEFRPSIEKVLDNVVPSYVTGFIYSALVDSFCSEQNARMTAMDSANTNAQKILDNLKLQYNHIRQSIITQEITEVSSAAKSMKRKAEKRALKEVQQPYER